ncbi:AsmA family protein [Vibrionales bacterium C3R12]|nr:AsmA family protein [Vibrionales bacterium C3R12]
MKKLLLFISVPIFVIVLAVAALVLFVNPNQFKPLITEQAQKQTGLELNISGDIGWTFFPTIGFEMGKTELKNPQGFSNDTFFKVDRVGIEIDVTPLFSQHLKIGNIYLDGAEVHLETLSDGKSNLDALTQTSSTAPSETVANENPAQSDEQPTASSSSAWSIDLAGITVTNALLEIQDHKAKTYTKLYDVGFSMSEFKAEQWTSILFEAKGKNNQQNFTAKGEAELKLSKGYKEYAVRDIAFDATFDDGVNMIKDARITLDRFEFDQPNSLGYSVKGNAADLALDVNGDAVFSIDSAVSLLAVESLTLDSSFVGDSLPQSPMKIQMNSDFSFDINKGYLDFVLEKLTLNKIQLDGKANITLADIPKVRFALHSPNIDLDEFLGLGQATDSNNQTDSAGNEPSPAKAGPEVEPDLSALKGLDVKGKITIDKFKANNARMQSVNTAFSINRGVVDLQSFSSNLYQGSIKASARLDARKVPATYSAKKQIIGVKVQPLLKDVANNDKLEGSGNINVDVKGKGLTPTGIKKNISGTIKINFEDGAVNGINVAQLIRTNYAKIKGEEVKEGSEAQKTDFSAMTATLTLNNGEVSTNNLNMQSPLLRIHGEGKANYISETADFLVRTSIVGSLEGQGGQNIDDLKDVTIPVKITGKWADPKFKLVFDDVLKQKAKKEVDRGVEKLTDKIKDEKTKEAVNGLLKGLFN